MKLLLLSNPLFISYIEFYLIRPAVARGVSTNIVVVAQITQKAITYFNCPTIAGLELENQGTNTTDMTSHWERRILGTEVN